MQRWRTERVYEDLKGELGLDHFEGRRFPGWHHNVSVALCCYAFIVAERVQHFPPSARRALGNGPKPIAARAPLPRQLHHRAALDRPHRRVVAAAVPGGACALSHRRRPASRRPDSSAESCLQQAPRQYPVRLGHPALGDPASGFRTRNPGILTNRSSRVHSSVAPPSMAHRAICRSNTRGPRTLRSTAVCTRRAAKPGPGVNTTTPPSSSSARRNRAASSGLDGPPSAAGCVTTLQNSAIACSATPHPPRELHASSIAR